MVVTGGSVVVTGGSVVVTGGSVVVVAVVVVGRGTATTNTMEMSTSWGSGPGPGSVRTTVSRTWSDSSSRRVIFFASKPAATSNRRASVSGRRLTSGSTARSGPELTVRVTVEPSSTSRPAGGFCLLTSPTGRADASCFGSATTKPRFSSSWVATSWGLPTTLVTVTCLACESKMPSCWPKANNSPPRTASSRRMAAKNQPVRRLPMTGSSS